MMIIIIRIVLIVVSINTNYNLYRHNYNCYADVKNTTTANDDDGAGFCNKAVMDLEVERVGRSDDDDENEVDSAETTMTVK